MESLKDIQHKHDQQKLLLQLKRRRIMSEPLSLSIKPPPPPDGGSSDGGALQSFKAGWKSTFAPWLISWSLIVLLISIGIVLSR